MAVEASRATVPAEMTEDISAQLRKHPRVGETIIEALLFISGALRQRSPHEGTYPLSTCPFSQR